MDCRQEEMEDLRERMRVETGLIVVGGADDCLRISRKKKKAEGITQSVVDRFIAVRLIKTVFLGILTFIVFRMRLGSLSVEFFCRPVHHNYANRQFICLQTPNV